MSVKEISGNLITVPEALKFVGYVGGAMGLLTVILSIMAYVPKHPDFSFFSTYLSDIGDTVGWPQIIFNSGTLLAAPVRYLFIVLLVMRLSLMGTGRLFSIAVLVIGFISTFGTVLMTAVPFSIAPAVHKSGIGLYFLGVVFLQSLIFIQQLRITEISRLLPLTSILLVVIFMVFFVLVMLLEKGIVSRNTPVIWEWFCFASSIVWLFTQSIGLGKVN
jgi:hypothetical membrane protein